MSVSVGVGRTYLGDVERGERERRGDLEGGRVDLGVDDGGLEELDADLRGMRWWAAAPQCVLSSRGAKIIASSQRRVTVTCASLWMAADADHVDREPRERVDRLAERDDQDRHARRDHADDGHEARDERQERERDHVRHAEVREAEKVPASVCVCVRERERERERGRVA